jgi:hypothetical protein
MTRATAIEPVPAKAYASVSSVIAPVAPEIGSAHFRGEGECVPSADALLVQTARVCVRTTCLGIRGSLAIHVFVTRRDVERGKIDTASPVSASVFQR